MHVSPFDGRIAYFTTEQECRSAVRPPRPDRAGRITRLLETVGRTVEHEAEPS